MNAFYLALIIVALISLAIGWAIGNNSAHKDKEKADEEMEFLEETNNLITTEDINLINAENSLSILIDIELGKIGAAKNTLIETLNQYYKTTTESISDDLATEAEKDFISKLKNLSKADKNIQKVIS
jgi:hypothetical protein